MPKSSDLSYFALKEPLSDEHIFTILGRAIPLDQLNKPIGGRMAPLRPTRASMANRPSTNHLQIPSATSNPVQTPNVEVGDGDGNSPPASPVHQTQPPVLDSESAVTEVGTPQRRSGEHIDRYGEISVKGSRQEVDLIDLNRGLYPEKAVVCRDIEILKSRAVGVKAKVAVETMLSGYTNYEKTKKSTISANGFRRIAIPDPQNKIEALLLHAEYADPIMELLRKQENKKAAIITSILTMTDLKQSQKTVRDLGFGTQFQTPGVQQGQPAPKTVNQGDATTTTHEELSGTYEGEVIIACSYLKLSLVEAPPSHQGIWYKITQAFRKLRGKTRKPNDKIEVSPQYLQGNEQSLYLPTEPIQGTIPVLFGPNAILSPTSKSDSNEDVCRTAENDDLDFAIFA